MRILCQANGYLPEIIGGEEVLLAHLYRALRAKGHDVLVIAPCFRDSEGARVCDGIDVIKFGFVEAAESRRLSEFNHIRQRISDTARKFRPDVVHLNDVRLGSMMFRRRGAHADVPRVLTIHSPIPKDGPPGLLQHLADEADVVVTISSAQRDGVLQAMSSIAPKVVGIANALPVPSAAPLPLPDARTFLFVGRLVPDKGADTAIDAIAELARHDEFAELVIAGHGPERGKLEQRVEAHGLSERVKFLGWVLPDDVPALMNACFAVVVPSRWQEPFGLVALQAAQMARPVIASRVYGLTDVVDDGVSGLLVAPDDPSALADAMRTLMRSPAMAERYGARGHVRALSHFDHDCFVTAYEAVFARACAQSSPATRTAGIVQ